jgi:probable phosphoglycerate mutase
VLWRHGRTAWNAERRFQGQTDIPLDEVGRVQASRAARALSRLVPSRIVASDLVRAADTAAELAALTGLSVETDVRLRETWAGEWEGLTRAELDERFPGELSRWAAGAGLRPGGGETRVEVADRMLAAISDALTGLGGGSTLVVATHGGSARAAIGALLGLPPQNWASLGVLANCAWSVLQENTSGYGPGWRLQEYNAVTLPVEALADDR